jgi:hypothetical protein
MKNHRTNVLEFQSYGILLNGLGRHTIQVMGAERIVQPPNLPATKEERSMSVDRRPFDSYYAEDAPETPDNELFQPDEPQVPALYVTRDGEVRTLGRDLESLA